MATKTDKYEFRKKEDNDFYDIEDYNDNLEKIETALTEFDDSGNAEGITSLPEMLAKLVTGNKLAVTLRNLKAGLQFVLHTGAIVNNCVTNNANLPLSAAQGKVLMDMVTQLNSDIKIKFYGKVTDLSVIKTLCQQEYECWVGYIDWKNTEILPSTGGTMLWFAFDWIVCGLCYGKMFYLNMDTLTWS